MIFFKNLRKRGIAGNFLSLIQSGSPERPAAGSRLDSGKRLKALRQDEAHCLFSCWPGRLAQHTRDVTKCTGEEEIKLLFHGLST